MVTMSLLHYFRDTTTCTTQYDMIWYIYMCSKADDMVSLV